MGIFENVVSGLFRKTDPVRDMEALGAFMDARAAFLAQKCVVEFCRVRAGVYWQKLFAEAEFQQALTKARWQSYPPAFGMIAELVEAALRETAGLRQRRLPGALQSVAGDVFARYPVPEGAPPDFWDDAMSLVRERLDATQAGPPRPVREMPDPLARMVFAALPLHGDIVTHDCDYIFNFLRMNLLRVHEEFIGCASLGELVDDLVGKKAGEEG